MLLHVFFAFEPDADFVVHYIAGSGQIAFEARVCIDWAG